MKFLKLFLIPMIALMFFIPVNASDELPPWATDGSYYIITYAPMSDTLEAFVISSFSNISYFTGTTYVNGYYVPTSETVKSYKKVGDGNWTSTGFQKRTFNDISYVQITNVNKPFKYSSSDIVVNGETVFPKTPVMNLAMVQAKALEGLTMEVQGTSGKILVIGGQILGAILVVHLINRSRLWVRV